MGIIQIQISDDVRAALEKAYPDETIEAAVERLLLEKVVPKPAAVAANESLSDMARRIRSGTPPTSDDEIRALRHEGRP
jgi:hypothetical protein